MNRRNFILGLGTAATLSGAASVTSAAFSGSTEPGADFRIISAEALTVRRNGDIVAGNDELKASLDGYVNESNQGSDLNGSGNFDFSDGSGVYNYGGPNLTINASENGGLNMSLATPNDESITANTNASGDGNPYYNATGGAGGTAPLEVENTGAVDQAVGVEYGYSDFVGQGGNTTEKEVAQLFTFSIGGTQISPNTTDTASPEQYVTVPSGQTREVDFDINYSQDLEDSLAGNFSDTGFGASAENLNLLNTVRFGIDDGT